MHHLARHAVACFLTRGDLYLSWTHGRDWFDRQLLDGDPSLNNANWLWLAGVAPFSAPYFRVYSPVPKVSGPLSAVNAEQTGDFVRFWVPELRGVDTRFIYEPSAMGAAGQQAARCVVGRDYPRPIVDHRAQEKKNIAAFKAGLELLREGGSGGAKKRPAGASSEPPAKRTKK